MLKKITPPAHNVVNFIHRASKTAPAVPLAPVATGSEAGEVVPNKRVTTATVIPISRSIVARPQTKPTGQQVVARVVENQINRIFPQLSSAAREAMANDLRGVLENDPRIQQIASEIS